MAVTNFTPLLGLALPTTGDLSGTWGTTVNTAITDLLDDAVAGTVTLSADADVTLTTTNGADNQARNAVILWTASNGATTRNITAPAQSKAYVVINAGTGSVVIRGSGPTTGVTVVSGEKCLVAWNGSDFVKISTTEVDGVSTISFGSTGLTPSTATSGAVTVAGTLAVANGGTGATTAPDALTNLAAAGTGISNTFTANQIVEVTDNTNAALRITQLGTGNALLVEDDTNPDASPFVIDASGQVIAGYTSSIATVSAGSSVTPNFEIIGSSFSASAEGIYRYSASSGAGRLIFSKSRTDTIGSQAAVISSDDVGVISYSASDGTAFIEAARITAAVDGTPGTNDMPGRLVFSTTADGASTATERMRITSAGNVGIGGTPTVGQTLVVSKNITGATTSFGVNAAATVQSDVTTSVVSIRSSASTAAAAFTLPSLIQFQANQGTIGATSSVTNQFGFVAESSLIGATNNYGFYGNITSGTNRFNLYMNGTANNYMAGRLGIGTTSVADALVPCAINPTGGATIYGFRQFGTVQSDVTNNWIAYQSVPNTAAAAFTLTNVQHFVAGQGTIGASSVVTNQFGFVAQANLTGATNNYAFYGNIAAPTSGITTAGTISTISSSGTTVTISHNAITYTNGQTVTISATANATALVSGATATILTTGTTSQADWNILAGTVAVTYVVGSTFTAAVSGSGITGSGTVTLNVQGSGKTVAGAASGSFTYTTTTSQTFAAVTVLTGTVTVSTRFNLYMIGTAANYFNSDLTVYGGTAIPAGGTTGSGYKFSSTANFGVFFGSGAPTLSAAKGSLYLRSDGTTTNNRMYVNTDGSTTWTAVTTAA